MCESSLINLVEMIAEKGIKCSKLTNIVNGHATKSEKSSAADIKTKARTIEQFLGECAIPERGIEGIDSNVAFLKINELYSRCFGENGNIDSEKVKECTRGFWSVGARRRKKIEFLFALYKRRVVGIYRVVKVHTVADSKLIDLPSFPLDVRKIDKWKFTYASLMEAKRNLNACDYKVFLKDLKNEKMSKTKALKRFRQRVYFSVNDDVPKCIGEYVNTLLTKNNSGMFLRSQKSVRYNF